MNNDNISIKDNNSQILSILPKEWVEPLIIIAKVKGYSGIDQYVLELIASRLEMFVDTRDELGEAFQKYMQGIEGLEGLVAEEESDKKEYVNVEIDANLVNRLEKLEERKKQQKQSEEDNEEEKEEEEIAISLKLDKNIFRLLKIFANAHASGGGNTEQKRLDEFTAQEITKLVRELAGWPEGPAQEGFPDSLKQHIKNYLNGYEDNEKKRME